MTHTPFRKRHIESFIDETAQTAVEAISIKQASGTIKDNRGNKSHEDFAAQHSLNPLTIRRWESGRVASENMQHFADDLRNNPPNLEDLLSVQQLHDLYFKNQPGVNEFGSRSTLLEINKMLDGLAAYTHAKSGIFQHAATQNPNFGHMVPNGHALVADAMDTIDAILRDHTDKKEAELVGALPSVGLTSKQAERFGIHNIVDYSGAYKLLDEYFRPMVEEICATPEANKAVAARINTASR